MQLSTWLNQFAVMHKQPIQLGLSRVAAVGARLGLLTPKAHVITVAGTNGKGSTVASLESIYLAAGFKVGVFTSPYLFRYTEQVRVLGLETTESALVEAFQQIESVREDILLTPFEWLTLAAFWIFNQTKVEIMLLEVGLGGRLDAVNVIDPAVSVITSISLDHCEYLGHTRDLIGREKAGIFRKHVPAVYGEPDIPQSILDYAQQCDTPLFRQSHNFVYEDHETDWCFKTLAEDYQKHTWSHLPKNGLFLQNLSTSLMAVVLSLDRCPVSEAAIRDGLMRVKLPGRVQVVTGPVPIILDVAHNEAACAYLAKRIAMMPSAHNIALFSMLADKDISRSIAHLRNVITTWHVAPVDNARSATMEQLKTAFDNADIQNVTYYPSLAQAYQSLQPTFKKPDRLIVFGSFHTVAEVYPLLDQPR